MRIRMLSDQRGADDGFTVRTYFAGKDYDIGGTPRADDLAAVFLREGWAEQSDAKPATVAAFDPPPPEPVAEVEPVAAEPVAEAEPVAVEAAEAPAAPVSTPKHQSRGKRR